MLFCHVTSMVESDPHQDLLGRKGGSGWPYIVVMDPEGRVLAKHTPGSVPGTFRTTPGFARTLAEARATRKEIAALREKAEAGDNAAALELLEKQVELSHLTAAEAREKLAALEGVPAERIAALDREILLMEVAEIQARATNDPDTHYECGKRFAAMVAAGRVPPDDHALYFWYFTSVYAEKERDADLYARALDGLREHRRRLSGKMLERMVKKLEELRAEKGADDKDG